MALGPPYPPTDLGKLDVRSVTDAHGAILDTFIRERIGNPNLDFARIAKVAREENWRAANAAACLVQPQAWGNTATVSESVGKLLRTCQQEKPEQVAAWLNAAVFGAVMSCPNTRAAIEIGSLLLAGSIISLRARGQRARDMVFAARSAVKAALPVDNPANIATDPLPVAAEHMRTLLLSVPRITPDHVFPCILDCFGGLDDDDRQAVTAAILANNR